MYRMPVNQFTDEQAHEVLMDRRKVLPLDFIQKRSPSIFSDKAGSMTSSRYNFIPTSAVLEIMQSQGWLPVSVGEQRVRTEAREGFQRHTLRFRNFDKPLVFNGSTVEMVLVNSHDGKCAYQIHAGLFRLVCLNGMVVSDSLFNTLRVRHQGNLNQDFIDVSAKVIENVPKIAHEIGAFSKLELSREEKEAFVGCGVRPQLGSLGQR